MSEPTREEKLQTIAMARQLFENMSRQLLPSRAECDEWRENINRLSGKPQQPTESAEEKSALLEVLAQARKQREQR